MRFDLVLFLSALASVACSSSSDEPSVVSSCNCGAGGGGWSPFPGTPPSCSGSEYVVAAVPASQRSSLACSSAYVFCVDSVFGDAECLDAAPDAKWHLYVEGGAGDAGR
jgi:hypothetical protein